MIGVTGFKIYKYNFKYIDKTNYLNTEKINNLKLIIINYFNNTLMKMNIFVNII